MIDRRSKQAGITKQMSPHRVRHSAITAYLDASGGYVGLRVEPSQESQHPHQLR
jgi:site-specific recombinase XerC